MQFILEGGDTELTRSLIDRLLQAATRCIPWEMAAPVAREFTDPAPGAPTVPPPLVEPPPQVEPIEEALPAIALSRARLPRQTQQSFVDPSLRQYAQNGGPVPATDTEPLSPTALLLQSLLDESAPAPSTPSNDGTETGAAVPDATALIDRLLQVDDNDELEADNMDENREDAELLAQAETISMFTALFEGEM